MKKALWRCLLILAVLAARSPLCRSQNVSLSTNLALYYPSPTLNLEAGFGVGRHVNVVTSARYNPFSSYVKDESRRDVQRLFSLGARLWPWHIYSGWWLQGRLQYQEYGKTSRLSPETSEGDRYGGGIAAGYSKMLGKHVNLDFGFGLWAGYDAYTVYSCPRCGRIVDSGQRLFLLPDEAVLALVYIF